MTAPSGAAISRRIATMLWDKRELFRFDEESLWAQRRRDPGALDFVEGDPHEMPPEGYTEALLRQVEPRDPAWYAYKVSRRESREVVAAALREQRGLTFDPADIHLTTGAFGGLAVALATLIDPGDEVIYQSPTWFWYDSLIAGAGGNGVRVRLEPPAWELDAARIAAAITPRTRAVILNTPHNPTGRIYSEDALRSLAAELEATSRRFGRPIFLVADESYARIVYDGRTTISPTTVYPWSMLIYTYGKTLLTPGQRIGYLAVPPELPVEARRELRAGIPMAQRVVGYAFPNALLQYALPDLERLSVDMTLFQHKRDLMVGALRDLGYRVEPPEGTFYLLGRSPIDDDLAFVELLAWHGVYVLPGAMMDAPGYFRVSLTASVEMIERALPSFAAAIAEAKQGAAG